MSNDETPRFTPEMFHRPTPGDCSKADISDLRRLVQPNAHDNDAENDTPSLDKDALQALLAQNTPRRPTQRAYTRLTEEQELAVKAYAIMTDQDQSAVIRLAVARFVRSDVFRTVVKLN